MCKHFSRRIILVSLCGLLAACTSAQAQTAATPTFVVEDSPYVLRLGAPTATPGSASQPTGGVLPTLVAGLPSSPRPATPTPAVTPTGSESPTSEPVLPTPTRTPPLPDAWMAAPITPTVSENTRQIYLRGLAMGRDPHAFSKVGDCQSITTYFLAHFETPNLYRLGDYAYLQETIDWFSGSFSRESLSVKGGLNAAAMLSPFRADPKQCLSGETPMACEYRLHNPSLAIISLEEWWMGQPQKYENYMRQIIEYTIQQGIVPIIGTKADNIEGDHAINTIIYRLAWEYDIPLWNFWAAVQPLPGHGVLEDGFHLTHGNTFFFDDPQALSGWAARNLTALMALDAVRRQLTETATPTP